MGLLTGKPSAGLTDLDLDCAEALVLALEFLPATERMSGHASRPRSHFWYVTDPELRTKKFADPLLGQGDKAMLLEVRAGRCQTLVAPTLHPSGERITWDSEGEPAQVAAEELLRAAAELAAACLISRYWPARGSRHAAALAWSGYLLRAGAETDLVVRLVARAAETARDEEWRDRAVDVRTTSERLEQGEAVTGLPRLIEIGVDPRIAERVTKWLGLRRLSQPRERDEEPADQPRPDPNPSGNGSAPGSNGSAPSSEEAHPTPELGELLDQIERFVERYVALSKHAVTAVVLWIVLTHVFDQFDTTPYLAITSPEKRSGKTRLLDTLALFVARVWRAVMPSEAVVFRKIAQDAPTLLLDEVDAIYGPKAKEAEGLRALLNAGHKKGARVPRCVGEGSRMRVEEFETFCPKALAGIGDLPDTVADRSIPIRLRRRAPNEKVERFRQRVAEEQAKPIREALERWAAQARGLGDKRPALPDELDDRAADGWEPLLAIADLAAGEWPDQARTAARVLNASRELDETTLGVRLLDDLRRIFLERGSPAALPSEEILRALVALEEAPWSALGKKERKPLGAHGLARLLRPYAVHPKAVRIGDRTPRGYAKEDLLDPWHRYLSPLPSSQEGSEAQHRNNGSEDPAGPDPCCGVADQWPSGRKGGNEELEGGLAAEPTGDEEVDEWVL